MKSTKAALSSIENSLSIPAAEELIEDALSELAYSTDPGIAGALRFLAPQGYQAIVELCGENGRSKRRNVSADTWSPEEDEVRIYFERIGDSDEVPQRIARSARSASTLHAATHDSGSHPYASRNLDDADDQLDMLPADMDARVKELCAALAEAERGGHAFIALKWFRDSFLPRKAYRWNQHPETRQVVLAEAIQRGVVITSKIANPKTPAYPTTTIRLNRAEAGLPDEMPRFHPVSITGEAFADDIDGERGATQVDDRGDAQGDE
jgi:hypothetical protein